jgi:hypothetical protein
MSKQPTIKLSVRDAKPGEVFTIRITCQTTEIALTRKADAAGVLEISNQTILTSGGDHA